MDYVLIASWTIIVALFFYLRGAYDTFYGLTDKFAAMKTDAEKLNALKLLRKSDEE